MEDLRKYYIYILIFINGTLFSLFQNHEFLEFQNYHDQ